MRPETKYALSGDVSIAYQVIGGGSIDIVYIPGFVSHLEYAWEDPNTVRLLEGLASFARLICFDKRGTGLSDRNVSIPTLEHRMDDVRAVMDAAGSERACLFGTSEGGPMSLLFSATFPGRTTAMALYGSYARLAWALDHRCGRTREELDARLAKFRSAWGTGATWETFAPSLGRSPGYREWCATFERLSASPGAVAALLLMNYDIDARQALDSIRVPTLVLHRTGDRNIPVEQSRYMARRIPGAKYVELPGDDHSPWAGDVDGLVGEIEEFFTGVRHRPEPDRVLTTILFTDIVDSTRKAVELGDQQWRDLLERHHTIVRAHLGRFRGREIDTAGDGFLAAFDGPARAVRAATAITSDVKKLGVNIRAGVHTGECETMGKKLSGVAVHVGARVASLAAPGEVLVSRTVKDLVAGSGLRFRERGAHQLKGVPGEWHLYAVDWD